MNKPNLDMRGNPTLITAAHLEDYAERLSNWGRWGETDQLGTLNFVTPDKVANAARLVTEGARFSLGLPFDQTGPQTGEYGRINPVHFMRDVYFGTEKSSEHICGIRGADDWLVMPMQSSTHWDALSHIFYRDRMYNGFSSDLVTTDGAKRNGIEHARDKMAGRGLLLDVARAYDVDMLPAGFPITPEVLDFTAERQQVEVDSGDFLIIRTGMVEDRLKRGVWNDYVAKDAPGLSFETAEWLHRKEVAAVAMDTFGCEVIPNNAADILQPWHWIVIPIIGLTVGENFFLKDLADHCAQDERYAFFFVAPPLIVTGSVSGAVNPMAFK